jgi:prophage maintenance system killer protein
MKKKILKNNIIIYQTKSGALELRKDVQGQTIWATQAEMALLYGKDQSVISRHIASIFSDGEVDKKRNMQEMHIANSDKPVVLYGLDIVLAVGYRTNSQRAIEFRQWATKTLRQYIVEGYAINKQRIVKNYGQFLEAVESVKRILPPGAAIDTESVLELVNLFADTWLSLDAYDQDAFVAKGTTKKRVTLTAKKLEESLATLKTALMEKGEASEHFGAERQRGSVSGIVGNVMQSFGGKELYESVEEKAAYLLYFMIKNHPFVDGNKRSGAYAFVWFLRQANILDTARMTPPALTALTILVASSDPKDKDRVIGLILTLIAKG